MWINDSQDRKVILKLRYIALISFVLLSIVGIVSFMQSKNTNATASEIIDLQNDSGQIYDGVDFDSLMNGQVYFGAIKHAKTSSITENNTTRETDATPILWKAIGEDGSMDGLDKDGAIALYSKYAIEYTKFSWTNNSTYEEWSGEADYDTSFISHWLNATDTYNHTKMHGGSFKPVSKWGFANSFLVTEEDKNVSYNAEYDAITKSTVSTYFIAQGKTTATSETVVTTPGDIYQHINGSITQGEWTSYFGGNYNSNRTGWPVTQTNVVAYIPFGVWSRENQPSHNTTFYNANGLPRTNSSEDYSIGVATSDLTKTTTKYGSATSYWLRNPNGLVSDAGSTYTYYVGSSGNLSMGITANGSTGIRPITKLDPKKVIITHEIVNNTNTPSQVESDKSSDTFWNYNVDSEHTNYKLTVLSDDVKLNELHDSNGDPVADNTLKLDTSKGETFISNDFVGDYLAYKIVEEDSDGSHKIVAYGTSKNNTNPAELYIDGLMNEIEDVKQLDTNGNYTLYIWAQAEDNSGKDDMSTHSFEGSQTIMIKIIPENGGDEGNGGDDDTYKITFNGNGNTDGLEPIDNNEYYPGDTATILDPGTLIKDGNIFIGWNTKQNGTGTLYKAGSMIVITNDLILYAQWKPYETDDNTDKTPPVYKPNIIIPAPPNTGFKAK